MNIPALSARAALSLAIAVVAAPVSADYVLRQPLATGVAQAIAPTIGQLSLPADLTVESPQFTLTAPTSNSAGEWTYSSSDPAVATISNATVTVTGEGTTTITATQAAGGNYTGGSASAALTVAPAPVAAAASCNALLTATPGLASGWYTFDPDGTGPAVEMSYYCDMASAGGGWTRIVRQTEAEPVTNWNGGVNGASYAITSTQIPAHTHVAFGVNEQATAVDYVPMTYTTGNIEKTTTAVSPATGRAYAIARSSAGYYPYLDPNKGGLTQPCFSASSNGSWCGALSLTHSTNNVRWIFAPENNMDVRYRGYALQPTPTGSEQWRYGSSDTEAWTVWVR